LFKTFDENNDGVVTADEIYKSLMAMGHKSLTLNDAKEMISSIDSDGDGRLSLKEFKDLMIPKMKDELLKQEDNVEDLRAMFLEADIDHSGTLTLDEMYSVILKMGAEVT
jgi:Ca2+-binding EF-hand superfamily protein